MNIKTMKIKTMWVCIQALLCVGSYDNSFLKFFGGMNGGKPDALDRGRAKAFAKELKRRFLYPLTSG